MTTTKTGKEFEKLATRYLKKNGFRIIENNAHAGHKEIDIIATKNNTIHFVEVKGRTNESFGEITETISSFKAKHLITAAKIWLQEKEKENIDWQIDFLGIMKNGAKTEYTYLPNAISEL